MVNQNNTERFCVSQAAKLVDRWLETGRLQWRKGPGSTKSVTSSSQDHSYWLYRPVGVTMEVLEGGCTPVYNRERTHPGVERKGWFIWRNDRYIHHYAQSVDENSPLNSSPTNDLHESRGRVWRSIYQAHADDKKSKRVENVFARKSAGIEKTEAPLKVQRAVQMERAPTRTRKGIQLRKKRSNS